ncbi:unnamed protein product [Prorocentrum cordatum]|uniref:Solute carrier family 40 protein n=1 Tax=Prorocentrum cordatum TaxID=2364126 RepID=A0ABN9TFL0_9DINO|nr:unnamed protein product [Polarella glacialis]
MSCETMRGRYLCRYFHGISRACRSTTCFWRCRFWPRRAPWGAAAPSSPRARVCSTFVMALSYSRKALGWWPDGPAGMQGSCAARAVAAPLLAAGLGLASGRGCVYCAPAVAVSAATWALAFASLGPARPVVHWVLFAFAAVSFSLFCRLAENMAMNPRLSNTAQGAMRLPVDCISTFGTILIFQMLAQVGIGWLSEGRPSRWAGRPRWSWSWLAGC